MSREIEKVEVKTLIENTDQVKFRVTYRCGPDEPPIAKTYELTRKGLTMTCEVLGRPDSVFFQVPLIETNGAHRSRVETGINSFRVAYQGRTYWVRSLSPGKIVTRLEEFTAPNRNGVYRVGVFSAKGNRITCRLSIE